MDLTNQNLKLKNNNKLKKANKLMNQCLWRNFLPGKTNLHHQEEKKASLKLQRRRNPRNSNSEKVLCVLVNQPRPSRRNKQKQKLKKLPLQKNSQKLKSQFRKLRKPPSQKNRKPKSQFRRKPTKLSQSQSTKTSPLAQTLKETLHCLDPTSHSPRRRSSTRPTNSSPLSSKSKASSKTIPTAKKPPATMSTGTQPPCMLKICLRNQGSIRLLRTCLRRKRWKKQGASLIRLMRARGPIKKCARMMLWNSRLIRCRLNMIGC